MYASHAVRVLVPSVVLAGSLAGPSPAVPHDLQVGDVICGVGGGNYRVYDNSGVFIETINNGLGGFTTGASFFDDPANPPGRLYTTDFTHGKVVVIDGSTGHAILQTIDTSPPGGLVCESIALDYEGYFYVGHVAGDQDVQKYGPAGNFLDDYDVAVGTAGSDWLDLSCEQQVLYYTSEGTSVYRYDVANDVQLADFATGLPGNCFALRLLPPYDGTGGMLVAASSTVLRLDGAGSVVHVYDVFGVDHWFAISLDPNASSFWAGDLVSSDFYRFDILTGALELGPISTGAAIGTFTGMTVVGEPTACANDVPEVEQVPPDEELDIPTLVLSTYQLSCVDPNPGDSMTLTALELPPGATHTPPLPLVGGPDEDLTSVFEWTPVPADVGRHTIHYSLTDSRGGSAEHAVTLNVLESYLILGNAPGTDAFSAGGHVFATQISELREWHVATPQDTPAFEAPPITKVRFASGPFGGSGTSGLELLDSFRVQAVMFDPVNHPTHPEQHTGGLFVRIWNTGQIIAEPYGQPDGMQIQLEVFVGEDGKRYYRFVLTIEPASR